MGWNETLAITLIVIVGLTQPFWRKIEEKLSLQFFKISETAGKSGRMKVTCPKSNFQVSSANLK